MSECKHGNPLYQHCEECNSRPDADDVARYQELGRVTSIPNSIEVSLSQGCQDYITSGFGTCRQCGAPKDRHPEPISILDGPSALEDIADERVRQMTVEGWTVEHDDQHRNGELAVVASCYADWSRYSGCTRSHFKELMVLPDGWPSKWHGGWWKPTTPRRDLVKAGALIVAEIERLDRVEACVAAAATQSDVVE